MVKICSVVDILQQKVLMLIAYNETGNHVHETDEKTERW